MASDRLVSGSTPFLQATPKQIQVGDFQVGWCGNISVIQAMCRVMRLSPPEKHQNTAEWLQHKVVETLYGELFAMAQLHSAQDQNQGLVSDASLLIAARDGLYFIDSDLSCGKIAGEYYAIGSGAHYAIGAMHGYSHESSRLRLEAAMHAACSWDTASAGPWDITCVN